ncbi:MAG: hypothetical protein ABEJ00_03645, partial [Gemmatimonadota bacterium]
MTDDAFRAGAAGASLVASLVLAVLLAAPTPAPAQADGDTTVDPSLYEGMRFRLVGPTRGGRV